MRLLLIDHGRCDSGDSRARRVQAELARAGTAVAVCGPSSVPRLEDTDAGMFGIHLHDIAAASHRFLDAVRDGSAGALVAAVPALSPRLLGSVRETARQLIAEAVDATDPDAVFVMHAGILADLAVETGVPVAVHVDPADLDAVAAQRTMRKLVVRALGSSEVLVAADEAVAGRLREGWVEIDAAAPIAVWPLHDATGVAEKAAAGAAAADATQHVEGGTKTTSCAERIAAACRLAIDRRRGV